MIGNRCYRLWCLDAGIQAHWIRSGSPWRWPGASPNKAGWHQLSGTNLDGVALVTKDQLKGGGWLTGTVRARASGVCWTMSIV